MVADDTYEGCGISPLATGKKDPFFAACAWHDAAYLKNSIHQKKYPRSMIDRQFLNQMLYIADGDSLLIARAYLYYFLAKIFGPRFWEGKVISTAMVDRHWEEGLALASIGMINPLIARV